MKQLLIPVSDKNRETCELGAADYRYLVSVLRKRVGDIVPVGFSDGSQISATITEIDALKKAVHLQFIPQNTETEKPDEDAYRIILLQWLLKAQKMDAVVRQATEIGVCGIIPVIGEFSVVQSLSEGKAGRYERIVREARQQSGSRVQTMIHSAVSPEEAILAVSDYGKSPAKSLVKICFTEKSIATKKLHEVLAYIPKTVVIAIGAEGGFSNAEYELLYNAGFVQCHFDTNVLRAETACVYALAAVQTILKENKTWQLKELT